MYELRASSRSRSRCSSSRATASSISAVISGTSSDSPVRTTCGGPLGGLGIRRVAALQLAHELHLGRIRMRDGEILQRAVRSDEVDAAPVGDRRHRRVRDVRERALDVERAPEQRPRLDEEPLPLLCTLAVVDVGRRPDPAAHEAVLVPQRQGAAEVPAIASRSVPQPVLAAPLGAGFLRRLPAPDERGQVVRVDDRCPAGPVEIAVRTPGVLVPAVVEVRGRPGDVCRPHDLRHRLGERAVALLAHARRNGELLLAQALLVLAELLVLLPELDEDGDLRAQHVGVERLEQVVDGADRVAAEDVLLVLRDRGQEDDRDVPGALALA